MVSLRLFSLKRSTAGAFVAPVRALSRKKNDSRCVVSEKKLPPLILGVLFKIFEEHPCPFYYGSPPPPRGRPVHIKKPLEQKVETSSRLILNKFLDHQCFTSTSCINLIAVSECMFLRLRLVWKPFCTVSSTDKLSQFCFFFLICRLQCCWNISACLYSFSVFSMSGVLLLV